MVIAATQPANLRKPGDFTIANAKAASERGVAVIKAKRKLLAELKSQETVSRATRDKLGMITKFLVQRVKPGRIMVKDIDDLRTLVGIADTVFAWSAKDSPQNHLHLHDVGKMLAEREESVSKPAQSEETPAIAVNVCEFQTHQPEK